MLYDIKNKKRTPKDVFRLLLIIFNPTGKYGRMSMREIDETVNIFETRHYQ